MTFSEQLSAVYDDIGEASSPAASIVTRIKRYLNEGLRVLAGDPGLTRLLDSDSPYSFASVADTARYVLPEAATTIHVISERTNDRTLLPMSLAEYRKRDPDPPSNTGTPTHYVPIGRVGVATQPSNASEIFVKSTSASDTGTAYLEGLITGGYRRTLSVSMTGTTAVSLSAAVTTFEVLEDFYISANAVGTVTLHEDSGVGTELARITIGQKRPRYFGFYLWPTPSAAATYFVDYRRELVELVNDADEPPFDTDFHYLLPAYARMRHWEKHDDTRHAIAKAQYEYGRGLLRYKIGCPPGYVMVPGRSRQSIGSNLGPWFPEGRW